MSFKSGFFNSVNLDRGYTNEELSKIFDGVIEDGVYASIGNMLTVKADGDGMSVYVDTGRAWFHHVWMENDSKHYVQIEDGDNTYDRFDAVILEIDGSDSVRDACIKVLRGLADGSKPEMINDPNVKFYQIPLAYVSVTKGAQKIEQTDITSLVGTNVCPFVTGPLKYGDIENLLASWKSEFETWLADQKTFVLEWFHNLQVNMDENAAVNLQNQIDSLRMDLNNTNLEATAAKNKIVVGTQSPIEALDSLPDGTIYFQREE